MTTEIAEVGFSVPTSGLEKGIKALEALNPAAAKAERGSKKLADQTIKTNTVFSKLAKGGSVVDTVFSKIAAGSRKVVASFAGLIAGAVATLGFGVLITGARNFSASIGELATLLPSGSKQLGEMQKAARDMADEFGTNAAFQLKAFYGAVSAGADTTEKATKIVSQANKLAIGGITNVATGVDILTTATNAYAASGLTAVNASDILFVGMKAGKTTIGELASGLGNVIPIAAALGVGLDELVAGVAALTAKAGLSTSSSITSLRAILASLAKPTSEASELAKQLKIDFSTKGLSESGNLANFLQNVIDKTDGSADKLSVLFGSIEALNGVLAFTGTAGKAFIDNLDKTAIAAGATDAAVSVVAIGLDKRWGNLLQRLSNLSIDFGYALLSVVVPAAESVAAIFSIASDNSDALVISMGVLTATQLPALATGFLRLAFALTSYNALAIYSASLSYALSAAMYAIPFVAVVAGLTLAYRWFKSSGEAAVITSEAINSVDENSTKLSDTLINVTNGLRQTEVQLNSISKTEAMLAQQKFMQEYENSLIDVGDKIRDVGFAIYELGEIGQPELAEFHDLAADIEYGRSSVKGLIQEFDKLTEVLPEIAPIVDIFIKSALSAEILNNKVERASALMRFLDDKATDADKSLLGISQRNIASNIRAGASEAEKLASWLGIALSDAIKLSSLTPDMVDEDIVMSQNVIPNSKDRENQRNALLNLHNLTSSSSGGSGGGGFAVQITELQRLNDELTKIIEPFNQAKSAYDILDTAMQNGLISNDQFTNSLGKIQAAFLATGGSAEQWAKVVGKNTDNIAVKMDDLREKSINRLGDEFIDLAVDGKASFGDMAKSIIKDLLKIAWQALVVKPILDSFASGSSGGGFFGKLIGGLFSAKGNSFDRNGVTGFAKGSTFSNSVVNGPTPFMFGKGGANLGIMGEAGPEAVMPLQRGPDGSLGVQMYNQGGNTQKPNNTVQIQNTYVIDGAVSEEKIVNTIRQQGEQTKEDVKNSMVGWLNEYDENGSM